MYAASQKVTFDTLSVQNAVNDLAA